MNAKKDIQFQIPLEHAIALERAHTNGGLILPNKPGRNSKRDFTIYIPVTYEVKCDYDSEKYRNAYLEVWNCRLNEPSGLTATKADWWLHYTPCDARVWSFKPKTMLSWLEKTSGLELKKGKGDGNSDGYAVPLITMAKLSFVTSFHFLG